MKLRVVIAPHLIDKETEAVTTVMNTNPTMGISDSSRAGFEGVLYQNPAALTRAGILPE